MSKTSTDFLFRPAFFGPKGSLFCIFWSILLVKIWEPPQKWSDVKQKSFSPGTRQPWTTSRRWETHWSPGTKHQDRIDCTPPLQEGSLQVPRHRSTYCSPLQTWLYKPPVRQSSSWTPQRLPRTTKTRDSVRSVWEECKWDGWRTS